MKIACSLILTLLATTVLAEERPAAPFTAKAPAAKTGIERQEIRAQLLPRRFTTLAAEIGAKINRLAVAEGGAFKAGQVLVSFDCSMPQAMLQKARAELRAAEQTHSANKRLAELNSVGLVELEQSGAAVARFSAEVGAQKVVLGKCTITAPFAGRIAEQKTREQQYVQPGQPLLLVPSVWLGWLKVGYGFQVEIDETRKTYPAKFIRIGARVDPVSQSVKVAAAIDGKFSELIAGMSGRVRVIQP